MGAGLIAKKIIVIIIFLALSAINDIPYVSRILPYYLKQYFTENNKQLSIGDINFGITTGDILIKNIKILNDKKEAEITADTIFINLDLAGLITKKRFIVNALQIGGLKINCIIKDGKSNLDFLSSKEQDTASSKFKYQIKNILFSNGALTLNINDNIYNFKELTLNIPELSENSKNINIILAGALDRGKFLGSLNISQDGSINFNVDAGNLNIGIFKKTLNDFYGISIYSGRTNFSIKGDYSNSKNILNLNGYADLFNVSLDYKNYTTGFKQLQLKNFSFNSQNKNININSISSDQFYTKFIYDINENNEFKPAIKNNEMLADSTVIKKDTAEIQTAININNISLTNTTIISQLNLKSDTLLTTFDKTELLINNLNINQDTISFNTEIKSAVNGGGALALKLQFADTKNYAFNLNLTNATLPNFNAYFKDYIGYIFNLGKADIFAEYNLKDSILNSKFKLNLYNPNIKKTSDIFDAPLEFAFSKLRNSKGEIKLDIPVTGNINDLSFKFSKAFWKVVRNTLLTPFTFAVKPFDSKTENYYLLAFDFNDAKLTEDAASALNSVGKAVSARAKKNYTLELNFVTTVEEFNLPHLETLFKRRANQIEKYLAANFNINSNRILYKEIRRENIKIYEKELIELKLID